MASRKWLDFTDPSKAVLALVALVASWGCPGQCAHAGSVEVKPDLLSVSFPVAEEGWACGRRGAVLHTADGGESWVVQKSGTNRTLTGVSFVDANNGWAVGDVGTIVHTRDGGETWELQQSPVETFLMSVQFVNPEQGWAVGERTTILHTSDGGRTWQVQFQDEDFILKRVSFCDARNGWAAGEYGYIYHTANGGETWEKQGGDYGISEETGELVGGTFIFDIVAVDPQTAWGVGIGGYVLKTVDAGETWQEIKDPQVPSVHLFGVTADRRGTVLIGGDSVLLSSTNDGGTFSMAKAEPPITYGWVYRIEPRGKSGFVAVGKAGSVYLADAGAETWRKSAY